MQAYQQKTENSLLAKKKSLVGSTPGDFALQAPFKFQSVDTFKCTTLFSVLIATSLYDMGSMNS